MEEIKEGDEVIVCSDIRPNEFGWIGKVIEVENEKNYVYYWCDMSHYDSDYRKIVYRREHIRLVTPLDKVLE